MGKNYKFIFLQQNLARRHEPTLALNRLLEILIPFSYLSRNLNYLLSVKAELDIVPGIYDLLYQLHTNGTLPRIVTILLIQEPNLNSGGKITGFPTKTILCTDNNPRAAIITSSNINVSLLNHVSSPDCAVANLVTDRKVITVASFYHDINLSTLPKGLDEAADAEGLVVLAGDTNAHSTLWGSPTNNRRGDHWEDYILTNDLYILNDSSNPTFSSHLGNSHLDITLTKNPDRFSNWKNTQVFNGSDHTLISFITSLSSPFIDKYYQNILKTDWGVFQSKLTPLNQDTITSTAQLESQATQLVDNVVKAFNEACPPKKAFPGRPCRWWNNNLSNLLRKKNLAARETRKYVGTIRGRRALLRKRALGKLFRKHLMLEKDKGWKQFTSNITSPKCISSLLRSMKSGPRENMPYLRDADGRVSKTHLQNLDILRESHFKNSLTSFNINKGNSTPTNSSLPKELETFFTMELLDKAINEMPTGKTPGPDGIKNEVFRRLPTEYKEALLNQFKCSLAFSYLPTVWLKISTIYIRKHGKPDSTNPRTYRPIGLSSGFLKLMERLVNWRIKSTVLLRGIPHQHAFTMGKSTETALSQLVHMLEKAKYSKLKAMIVSIDIQGAFDNIPFHVITEALLQHGVDPVLVKWVDYMSRNRIVYSELGKSHNTFRPTVGTTQGGLNGPDFWAISLWNIIFLQAARRTEVGKFADDVFSALIGNDLKAMRDILQSAITEFNQWFKDHGLTISAQKSFCMIVNQQRLDQVVKPLVIDNAQVPFVKQMKYLGVIIDAKLSWKPHILEAISKAKRNLMIARRIVNKDWGLNPERALWIYEGIVRPALDYACHVWTPNDFPIWLEKELDRVQRLALVISTSCIKSTPTRALERLTNVIPLSLHLKRKAAITVNRIYNSVGKTNWDGIGRAGGKSHLNRWCKFLGNVPPQINSHMLNLTTFQVSFTNTPPPETGVCIYTDGSKIEGRVGLGWLIANDNKTISEGKKRLPDFCSVYEAEMSAIPQAINDLLSNILPTLKRKPETVTFLVDNQATLHSINKLKISGTLRVEVLESLLSLKNNHGINPRFQWVKSHGERGITSTGLLEKNRQSMLELGRHHKLELSRHTWKAGTRSTAPFVNDGNRSTSLY